MTWPRTYSDETDSLNVGVLVLGGRIVTNGTQFLPDGFTQQQTDASTALLLHRHGQCSRNGVLARVVETGQQNGETLLVSRRVGFSQDLDDGLVREPVGDGSAGDQSPSQFGTGDVGGGGTLGDFVDGLVLVGLGQVGDHLEGHHFDVEFVLELGDQLLGVVLYHPTGQCKSSIKSEVGLQDRRSLVRQSSYQDRRDLGQRSTGKVSNRPNHRYIELETYEVGSTVVLSDDSVPDGFSRTGHSHGQGQQGQVRHTVGVLGHQSLVRSNTGVVVDISGLGQTDNRVDQDVGLSLSGRSDGQFSVGSVHGVSGLESDDLSPCHLLEEASQLGRGVSQIDVVKVLGRLNGLDFSADVEFLGVLALVRDSRVGGVICAQDLFVLELEVGLENVFNGQDGETSVVSGVSKSDTGALGQAKFIDLFLGDIERDGHGEEVAILQSQGVPNAVKGTSCQPDPRRP
jgi:hypothetical protein